MMDIGFIGAGKTGCSLGKYFAEKGRGLSLNVAGYFSRSAESAKDAAQFTGSKAYADINELVDECDVIFLTVPDGSICRLWQQVRQYDIKGKAICHCSGAMSADEAFEGLAATGSFGYSIHPLFAVSDKYNAYRELTGVFFTLEGDDGGMIPEFSGIRKALEEMGNPTCVIDAQNKTMYHCAAAIASNLMCGLADMSVEMLRRCGFSDDEAVNALAPIMLGNISHISDKGPADSLTGPMERNDISTVKKHLMCLTDEDREIYRLLSLRLMEMARHRHPRRDFMEMSLLLGRPAEDVKTYL